MARKRLTTGQKVIGATVLGVLIYSTAQYYKKKKQQSPVIGGLPPYSGNSGQNQGSGYVSPMNYAGGTAGALPGGSGSYSGWGWMDSIYSGSAGSAIGGLPRGLKNNNPLNIIITGDQWQGKVPVSQNTDKKFEQFTNILYGYRAAIKTIKAKMNIGLDTIAKITASWAPAGSGEGNNPVNYAKRVSAGTGINPNARLSFDPDLIVPIIREMAVVENSEAFRNRISDNDIIKAWSLV